MPTYPNVKPSPQADPYFVVRMEPVFHPNEKLKSFRFYVTTKKNAGKNIVFTSPELRRVLASAKIHPEIKDSALQPEGFFLSSLACFDKDKSLTLIPEHKSTQIFFGKGIHSLCLVCIYKFLNSCKRILSFANPF